MATAGRPERLTCVETVNCDQKNMAFFSYPYLHSISTDYLRQVNVVSEILCSLNVCLSVCLCAAAWHHNDNDVITSPADCVLSMTSPAATLAARAASAVT